MDKDVEERNRALVSAFPVNMRNNRTCYILAPMYRESLPGGARGRQPALGPRRG